MSLYDNASLVMIPSGVKEDKLYSVKPTDGSGDFTFSRGSDIQATRVNSSGLIEKAKVNNLLNSIWDAVGTNVAPTSWTNGFTSGNYESASSSFAGNTAIRFYGTSARRYVAQSPSFSGIMALSVYVESVTTTSEVRYVISQLGGTELFWLEDNIVVANTTSISAGKTYTLVFNSSGTSEIRVGGGTTLAQTYDFTLSIPQLNYGLIAQDYVETTTTAVVEGLTADLPRLDYSGGASCPSLLLEPSRTNLFIQSEYLNTSYSLNAGTTLTDNYAISPEGVQNATRYVGTGGSGFGRQYTLTNGTDYTISAYVKSNTGATQYCRVIGDSSNISSDLEVTTEWTRVQYTWTSAGLANKTSGLFRDSSNNDIDILVYGMQLEAGSYPTSYIPTYSAAANRGKDSANTTGVSSLIGSTEGTIYLEVSALANDLGERRFALSDGTTGNVVRVGFTNVSNRILAVLYNGSNQCVLTYAGADITQTNKIAFTYAANDFALYVNGESRSTDTSGTTFSANTLDEVHFNEGDGNGNESYGNFDQVLVFPTRLTNAELAALTTL